MDSTVMSAEGTRYRAVVIGCGRIGAGVDGTADVESHAQTYRRHPRVELVGLCDIDARRLADAARVWGAEADSDPLALCRRLRPDVVSLCTPDATHYLLGARLLREAPPRLLFVEKPLALSAADAERLVQLAERQACAIAVNHTRRYSPAFQVLRDELRGGDHGCPLLARVLYGKGLFHNGSHAIDLLRFWLGDPVKASGQPVAWGPDDDETYSADLWFPNGCRGRLDGFDERVATVFEVEVLTERSRWRCWAGGAQWEFSAVADSLRYRGYVEWRRTERECHDGRFADPLRGCLLRAVDNIVDVLDGTGVLLCPGDDAVTSLTWLERIRGER
jgi:predicted dehydrogenase